MSFTQQELAAFANTTRESANRILREFADQQLIRLSANGVIVLDRVGLGRFLR